MHVRRCCGQRADMRADQMQCIALHDNVSFFQLRAARAYGFHLPAFEHDPGLEALLDKIVMEGFFVFDDTHMLRPLYQRVRTVHA